jgi:hypothetical protein
MTDIPDNLIVSGTVTANSGWFLGNRANTTSQTGVALQTAGTTNWQMYIDTGTNTQLRFGNPSNWSALTLDTSGNLTLAGNSVGIGVYASAIKSGYVAIGASGDTGFRLYNNGSVAEWAIHQHAHGTDDNLTFSTVAVTTFSDKMTLDTSGNLAVAGSLTVLGHILTGGTYGYPIKISNGGIGGQLNLVNSNLSGNEWFFTCGDSGLGGYGLYIGSLAGADTGMGGGPGKISLRLFNDGTTRNVCTTYPNGTIRNTLDDGSGNMKVAGFDFALGTGDQSSRGNTGASRALVKDTGGVLAINYANDFYGGVQVRSKLSSLNNTLDDGSGNMTIAGNISMPCSSPYFTWTELEPYLWGLQWINNQWYWTPVDNTLPLVSPFIHFNDSSLQAVNQALDIGVIRTATRPDELTLWISRHLIVKKDFACGGIANIAQGALVLGSDWAANNPKAQMPQIYLAHSEGSPYPDNPKRDTLEIWRAGHVGLGKLKLSTLYAQQSDQWPTHAIEADQNYLKYYNDSGTGGFVPYGSSLILGGPDITGYTAPLPWRHIYGRWIHAIDEINAGNLSGTGTRNVGADSNGKLVIMASSKRYKTNINMLQDCSWLFKLAPVEFEWKDKTRGDGLQVGLIAEDVHKIYPPLAWLDSQGIPEGVHYEWLTVPLLVELQKLRAEVDELKTKLASLTPS